MCKRGSVEIQNIFLTSSGLTSVSIQPFPLWWWWWRVSVKHPEMMNDFERVVKVKWQIYGVKIPFAKVYCILYLRPSSLFQKRC